MSAQNPLEARQTPLTLSRAWSVWGLAVLFYFYEFMLQTSTGIMVPDLMRAFNATGEQMGQLSAAYLYSYALMQIPAGILMDRVGP
ncbi:MAG: MFS transporter, partial [Pseudomonadota bacterium]